MVRGLRVHVIGGLAVDGVAEAELGSRKARLALRVLGIARGRAVDSDRLSDVLWGDAQPRDPAAQVAVIISRLRRVIGTERITHGDGGYALHADWIDLQAAEGLAAEAQRRLSEGADAAALATALAARALLAHPVLDDAWALDERRLVERLAVRARHLVARAALAGGDLATGVEAAEQALDADGYDEEALRLAMAALAAQGRTSSALALHERVRERLADELGASPSHETEAAHLAVLKGLAVPGIDIARARSGNRHPGALAGRAAELSHLDARLRDVESGTPACVVIAGEAGIGKTALVRAWIDSLERDVVVLSARCDQANALPLQPVLHALRDHLRRSGGGVARTLLGSDAPLLGPLFDSPSAVGADGADLSGMTASPPGTAMLFAALRRLMRRVCSPAGVLFIDDAQRADDSTNAWIADLLAGSDLPVLTVLARRDAGDPAAEHTTVLHLGPLTVEDATAIVGADRARVLFERSAGNPLFLTQLAAEPSEALPATVRDAVVSRCAELGPTAETLANLAVLGSPIDVDMAASVLRIDPIALVADLDAGVRAHLVEERDGAYRFRHEIVREALEASTTSPRRALLHREAAHALAALPDADPMVIAHHARMSGARDIAATALIRASRLSLERFDNAAALTLATEALDARDTSEARLQRAIVLLRMARYDDARADAETAVLRGDDIRALEVAGATAYYCCDFARGAALGATLIAQAPDERTRLQGMVIRARALHASGDVPVASKLLDTAMTLAAKRHLPPPVSIRAFLAVHTGEAQRAVAMLSAPDSTPHTASTIYTPVHAHFTMGYAQATLGHAGDALRVIGRAADEARRRGLARYTSLGANMSSFVLRNTGDVALARERNAEAREGANAAGYRELEVYSLLDPCDDALDSGDVAAAERCVAGARLLMRDDYAYRWRHELRCALLEGRIALLSGDHDRAARAADGVITDARSRVAPRYVHLAEVLRMRAGALRGEEPPDSGALTTLSRNLGAVAGLEAWWLLAELGAALASDACTALAATHVSLLATRLDAADRARFVDYAAARLARIRTRGRTG